MWHLLYSYLYERELRYFDKMVDDEPMAPWFDRSLRFASKL